MSDAQTTSIGRWISVLYRYGQCYIEKELKPYGLGSGQFIFLFVLLKQDGISQEALSNILKIDKGTTARAIQKLEQEGYIEKNTNAQDRRVNIICVTKKGKQIQPILQQTLKQWTELLSQDMTDSEKKQTIALLQKMADNALSYFKSLKGRTD